MFINKKVDKLHFLVCKFLQISNHHLKFIMAKIYQSTLRINYVLKAQTFKAVLRIAIESTLGKEVSSNFGFDSMNSNAIFNSC